MHRVCDCWRVRDTCSAWLSNEERNEKPCSCFVIVWSEVGMNLMEGALRLGSKEYRQFVGVARGSAGEVCYQLLLAKDLNYISNETYQELRSGYDRVIQMLSRLSQSLGNKSRSRPRTRS